MEERNIYNNPTGKPYCCRVGCNKDATQELRYSNKLEDYSQFCNEHIEEELMEFLMQGEHSIEWMGGYVDGYMASINNRLINVNEALLNVAIKALDWCNNVKPIEFVNQLRTEARDAIANVQ